MSEEELSFEEDYSKEEERRRTRVISQSHPLYTDESFDGDETLVEQQIPHNTPQSDADIYETMKAMTTKQVEELLHKMNLSEESGTSEEESPPPVKIKNERKPQTKKEKNVLNKKVPETKGNAKNEKVALSREKRNETELKSFPKSPKEEETKTKKGKKGKQAVLEDTAMLTFNQKDVKPKEGLGTTEHNTVIEPKLPDTASEEETKTKRGKRGKKDNNAVSSLNLLPDNPNYLPQNDANSIMQNDEKTEEGDKETIVDRTQQKVLKKGVKGKHDFKDTTNATNLEKQPNKKEKDTKCNENITEDLNKPKKNPKKIPITSNNDAKDKEVTVALNTIGNKKENQEGKEKLGKLTKKVKDETLVEKEDRGSQNKSARPTRTTRQKETNVLKESNEFKEKNSDATSNSEESGQTKKNSKKINQEIIKNVSKESNEVSVKEQKSKAKQNEPEMIEETSKNKTKSKANSSKEKKTVINKENKDTHVDEVVTKRATRKK